MKASMEGYTILLFCFSFLSMLTMSIVADNITMSQSLRDGNTIVSAGGSFALGFFSPRSSTKRYLGIWYNNLSNATVAWVANRETPLVDSLGIFKVTNHGILVLLNGNETTIWSSNASRSAQNPVVQLLESGNLVVRERDDDNPGNFLWQSFDHPCDTLLPGMKLGRNLVTGLDRYLSSWKSTDDPSQGAYTIRLEPNGCPQLVIRKGLVKKYSSGPWNGIRFSGMPRLRQNKLYTFSLISNQMEVYYTYEIVGRIVTRVQLNQSGNLQRSFWMPGIQNWDEYQSAETDNCDAYALCGAYGSCYIKNHPKECGCLDGFVAKSQKEWDEAVWSSGCVRRRPLDCLGGDGFTTFTGIKLPDTQYSWSNSSMTLEECSLACLKNCSCMAYTNLDISEGGSGCLHWYDDLIDIRDLTENGQEIYVRMASSSSGVGQPGPSSKKQVKLIVGLVVLAGVLFFGFGLTLYLWKKKKLSRQVKERHNPEGVYTTESQKEDLELPIFDWATVANATNNFSIDNKLGEGGFGPVYKGVLEGHEIAVKRLSKDSRQGLNEFKNEVACIAKLQHRNLVKLRGCCIQKEKMLIYEYMPNKSLDFFIFDETHSMLLNWHKRFDIINGIARGLLYLHQDSRLRIIHRDLKASNVLLDHEMNPKISDFGMARIFGENEIGANTSRVVGTYGYMSPEYQLDGLFSVKSDIFSFGVMVLEIVSGKKNRGFKHPDHTLNLLGHAWKLYKESRHLEMIDASMGDSFNLSQVLRSIHVGLLCVQQSPEDRPTMSSVVMMLSSEGALPRAKQPGFFTERNLFESESSSSKHEIFSTNEVTITSLSAR